MNDKIFPGDILIHKHQKTQWLCIYNDPNGNAFKVITKNKGDFSKGHISKAAQELFYTSVKNYFDLIRGTKAAKILFMPNEVNINE